MTASAVAALLLVVLVAVRNGGGDTGDRNPAAPYARATSVRWRTFSAPSFRFTVRYPTLWRAAAYSKVGTFSASVVYLSDQPMAAPCRTFDHGSRTECGNAVTQVAAGGVSVTWSNESALRPDLFGTSPGTPTTIGGVPAKVLVGTDSSCTDIGGRTSVIATVSRRDARNNVFVMNACVAAGRRSPQVDVVLASLRTMRQP